MRVVCTAAVIVVGLSIIAPRTASGALNLSITNYQTVSNQRASLTQWYVTFKADLVNTGPALSAITATIASKSSTVQVVAGQGVLHFSPVPANGRVTSADSFTLLIDRAVSFDWGQVEWSFTNPVAEAGANQTAPVTATVTLDGTACSNPSGMGTLSYNWSFQAVPPGSTALLAGPDTPRPSFVLDAPGTYKIRLTVSNGFGSDSDTVAVSTVNSPPVASAGPNQTVAVGGTVSLNGSHSSDVDGDLLKYSWSFISIPANSAAALLGAQTVSPTFVADKPGTYKAQLIVNDGKVDSQASTVTISTVNTPPVADAGDNQTVVAGMFVQLNGARSTDVDGDALTYRWSFNSLAPGSAAVIASPASVKPTFTADKAGTYIVQLIVNDGKIDSAPSTVTITTNAVQAPTANAGPDVTVHAGKTVQLDGSGTDPQHYQLSYSWSLPTRPTDSTASLSATNIRNPTFVADLPGLYAAQLVVSNGTLSSAPSMVTITTTNTAPFSNPGSNQVAYVSDMVYLDGSGSHDVDLDPITYSWTFTSKPEGSQASLSGANTVRPSFLADLPGPYVAQLIVSDPFASSLAKTVTVEVGTRIMSFAPAPLNLYNSPGTLSITLSPVPTTAVAVNLSAETPGIATFSPNPATVPANSSGVNVTVTPTSPGTTRVTASATGYHSSTATVSVNTPSVSIALNDSATTVGLTYKACGAVTLIAPAPLGGALITLSSIPTPDGAVGFESNTAAIAEGGTTGTFCVTGTQLGTATINAASPGYNSGSQTVRVVMVGSILLPSAATVGAGQSAPLNLQISAPAPVGGVTLSLVSSDTGKLTISPSTAQIRAGATAPDTPPQMSGAAGFAGEVSVSASAGGFFSDRQSIKVIAAITFEDQAVSVGPGGVKTITLLLSAPAPTGGLLVQLTSTDPSIASVSQTALVYAGQQSAVAQVTGENIGTADITLRASPSYPSSQFFSGAGAVLHVTVARPSLTITTASLPGGTAGANYQTVFLSATGGTGGGYSWSIPSGSLPKDLILGVSGSIFGTLSSTATTSTFTLQVQDSGGNKDSKTFTITVNAPLTIRTTALPAGTAGAVYASTTLEATGGSGGVYAWSLFSGTLPAGLNLSQGGVISGTLNGSAITSTFTVVVQDTLGATTSRQFTISVLSTLSITTEVLPVGTAGASYPSTTLTAAGGTGNPYTWSLSVGSLPQGLILSTGGVISGTPASATTSTFTIQAKDTGNNIATRQFTLTVNPALRITTASLPGGMRGADYSSTTLEATGGSGTGYTWSISAATLPCCVTLSPAGVLSGALASDAASSTFTIQVQDSIGATATKQFTITVSPALIITTASLPDGTAGASYPTQFLAASGGTGMGYTWSVSTGLLPAGLTLSSGSISGTLSDSAATSTFTVRVQDNGGNAATKQFTLTVNAALVVTTASLPDGAAGAAYPSTQLTATGGTGTGRTWSVTGGALPDNLTLSSTGVLSGMLSSSATNSTFTVQVRDSGNSTATKQFTLTINPPLSITTDSLPPGNVGAPYLATTLTAAGGSGSGYSWFISDGSLPLGLSLSGAVISGTLSSSAVTSTFTVLVQDSAANSVTKQFTITVGTALTISTPSLPAGDAGSPYAPVTLTAGGGSGGSYTWSIANGSLPANLTLSSGGVISGSLSSAAVTTTFTVQVQDSSSNKATRQFTITVNPALSITTTSLPAGTARSAYPDTNLTATGGSGTGYAWTVTVGPLPAGLTLSGAGLLSGTLSASATTSTFTVQVKDSLGVAVTKALTITVNPALTIQNSSLPDGMAGGSYPTTTLTASGGTGMGRNWSISSSSGLPAGLSLSSDGVLSGTLNESAATSTFTIQVLDSGSNRDTKEFTIKVNPALRITTSALPVGLAGSPYPSTTLAASGGTGVGYAWSVSGGALPNGLSLNSNGVLAGTLSTDATASNVTIQVQDSGGNRATRAFAVSVNPFLSISTPELPAGVAGATYTTTTLQAEGGTGAGYVWSVSSGVLPLGLSLTPGGSLSGTLSASATTQVFTIQVKDNGNNTATKQFTINVASGLGVQTASLPNGLAGTNYAAVSLAATGGTGTGYTWSVSAGSLPLNLTLTPGGSLSGTLSASATTQTFTIQVKDSGNNTATRQFTLTVDPALAIAATPLPAGTAGSAYTSTTLTASGGTTTGYTWSISAGSLPSGLALGAIGGVISGTLNAGATTSTFTVQVKDSGNNTAIRQFTITVNPVVQITTLTLPAGTAGSLYPTTNLTASGGTGTGYSWSILSGALPSGVGLSTGGALSGTLSNAATTTSFTVLVQDSGGNTARKDFTLTVTLMVTTTVLPGGTAGAAYTGVTLAASGGTGAGYTWSLASGSLPAGLALTPGGGISGSLLTNAVTQNFTVQVQDSGANTATRQLTITVTTALTINTVSLPAGMAGGVYPNTTLSASGGSGGGYTWSITAGSLPSGLTLSGALISGTLSVLANTATFTVQVKDSANNTATREFTLRVNPALTITTASPLTTGVAGSLYPNTSLAATGGTGSGYAWSIITGSLPAGLTLSGGVISGTLLPGATGQTFTVQVKDSDNNTATKPLTIPVNPALGITTDSPLATGVAGNAYPNTTLAATGGTNAGYTWSVIAGSLPTALSLSSGGVISGTLAIGATSATFTVQVKDSDGNTVTKQFTIPVNPALSITTASPLATGVAGNLYPNTTLTAAGGTLTGYTWSVIAGSLPATLSLSSGGVISGTLASGAASATFTVQVQDSGGNKATKQLDIPVNAALSVTTSSLPNGIAGTAYPTTNLTAAGGTTSGYTWSITAGSLPSGLNLNAGAISGTLASGATTAIFTVQVKDSGNNTATRQLTITVNAPLSVTTTTLPNGIAGSAYQNTNLTATGGAGGNAWSVTAGLLPASLSLSPAGLISGTLLSGATSQTFTVQVKDSDNNTATKQLTITVNQPLSITTASTLPTGIAGNLYPDNPLAAAGGTGGYAWSVTIGSLPSNLTLSSGGVISGTLASGATSQTFTVQVKDSDNNTATRQFTLPVNAALSVTTSSLPNGIAGTAYPTSNLTAAGGTTSGYTWSITAGSLPQGLTLNAGAISGTLASGATTQTFTVQVKDSGNNTATRPLTITVNQPLVITTASPLTTGTAGSGYPNTTLAATGGTGTGYTWSLATGSSPLPANLSLSAGGLISGTLATGATTATFTVQVKDSDGNTVAKQFTIPVNAALNITTASPLTTGAAGSAYPNTTLAATGGTGTGYTWSLATGSSPLPANLTLSAGGVISGTLATDATTATFTVQVKDDGNNTATKQFTLPVNPALSITTASPLTTGIAGKAYPNTNLAATGGTGAGYAWTVTVGSLPATLTLSSGGLISGTLASDATSQTFTVQVQDNGGNKATKQLTIPVNPPLSVTTNSLPVAVIGGAYPSTTLGATGGAGAPYTWSVTVGSLPLGLILGAGGAISGTPSNTAVTSTFTVQVKDSGNNTVTTQLTITVNPAVSISTASALPDGVVGSAYPSTTLVATGGLGNPYSWSVTVGSLPAGLSLGPADGVISGTLSNSATTSTFTVKAQDSGGYSASKQFTISVNAALSITTSSVPNGMAGAAYPNTTLTATGGTGASYVWSVSAGSLPPNLTLTAGGLLSGTLSASATTQSFTVQVKDSANNTATKQFTLTVFPTLTVTTSSLPNGTAGSPYTPTTLTATGGAASGYAWTVTSGALPAGLTLSGGVISGTLALNAVTKTFTVQVQDSGNFTATKSLTITVIPAPLSIITTSPLPNATVGTFYVTPITAVGGTLPYSWLSLDLPEWLALDLNGAVCGGVGYICGTPTLAGPVSFSVTVRDSSIPQKTAAQTFSLTVAPVGGVGAISVPNVSVGVNLQAPIYVSLLPAPSVPVRLTITSGNSSAVLLSFNTGDSGLGQLTRNLAAGDSNPILVYVKALTTSTPVTLTVAADSGYMNGSGTVTVTNSGFVLSGPNGIGGGFTTYQGVSSSLTLYPYRLGPGNVAIENQTIRGGLTVAVPVAVSPTTMGLMGSPTVTFNGGDQSQSVQFTASFSNSGNASIIASPPVGSSFISPATGGTLNVTIQSSGFIPPSGVTIGRNLEAPVRIGLNGPAAADTTVTVTSSDSTALKFATGAATTGAETIQLLIPQGATMTPQFYAQAFAGSGSVLYTIFAPGYGSVTSSMPLGPSGFVLVTPTGNNQDFSVTVGSPNPTLGVSTALFANGQPVEFQLVAPGATVTATLTSFTPGVGTVSPGSVQILGGTDTASASFHAVAAGTTNIRATASGYTQASVNATVTSMSLFLDPIGSVGQFLARQGTVRLNTVAPADVTLTVASNNSALQVAVNNTDPGAPSIQVVVKAGTTLAHFWVYGKGSPGSTGSYTITGAGSATDTVTIAASTVALYMGSPGGFTCLGGAIGIPCTITLLAGSKTVYAVVYPLTTDGTNQVNFDSQQVLAGGTNLTVPLSTSAPGVGTIPASVGIAGGASFGSFFFTPSTTGSTIVSLNNLIGWTVPALINGIDVTQLRIIVQ